MVQHLNMVSDRGLKDTPCAGTIEVISARDKTTHGGVRAPNVSPYTHLSAASFDILDSRKKNEKSPRSTDIGLIDLRYKSLSDAYLHDLTMASAPCTLGLIYLLPENVAPDHAAKLATSGEVVFHNSASTNAEFSGNEVLECCDDLITICRDIIRLRKIESEIIRRRTVSNPLHYVRDKATSMTSTLQKVQAPNVLIAGEPSPVVLSLVNKINQLNGTSQCVYRPGQAIRALEAGSFNAVVFLPRQSGDPLNALGRAMRRHQRFHTLPIINIDTCTDSSSTSERAGRIIPASQIKTQFSPILKSSLHKAATTKNLITLLDSELSQANRDHITTRAGLVSHHMQSLMKRADHAEQSLSFLTVNASLNTRHETICDDAIDHIEAMIIKSIRRSDMAMLLSRKTGRVIFAVSLGDQSTHNLTRIAGRIESLIRSSAINNEQHIPLALTISSGIFHRPHGLCLEETVAGMVQSISA